MNNTTSTPVPRLRYPLRRARAHRLGGHKALAARLRKIIAVALGIAAVGLAIVPSPRAAEPTRGVLVTTTDIAAGEKLQPTDVRLRQLPQSLIPDGALSDPGNAVGKHLSAAARRGEPLTDTRVLNGNGRAPSATGDETALVPITLHGTAVADLLHPGATVDVVTINSARPELSDDPTALTPDQIELSIDDASIPPLTLQRAQIVAKGATVVMVQETPAGQLNSGSERIVLLEVPAQDAAQLAALTLHRPLAVTLR